MRSYDARDVGAERLDRLMVLTSDPDRAERVRVRCRTQLERRGRRSARPALTARLTWGALPPMGLAVLCVLYVVVLVTTTLRLGGIVP
jgi:hypothetical protein